MNRFFFASIAALSLPTGNALALTADEISAFRGFEGEWGLAAVTPKTAIQSEGLDGRAACGAPFALNIHFAQDQDPAGSWRLYSAPEQSLGSVVVSVTNDGVLQRITAQSFAPIGWNTDTYEFSGDTLVVTIGTVRLTYKRC